MLKGAGIPVSKTYTFGTDHPLAGGVSLGTVIRCNPLVAGQPYIYLVSDGTRWRPMGGRQVLYALQASVSMTAGTVEVPITIGQQLVSVPIPIGLVSSGMSIGSVTTATHIDPLEAYADTAYMYLRIGAQNSNTDVTLHGMGMATTVLSAGCKNLARRASATTIQKQGAGTSWGIVSLSSTSSATTDPITLTGSGNFDTTINYLGVYGQMSIGTGETGMLTGFNLELIG